MTQRCCKDCSFESDSDRKLNNHRGGCGPYRRYKKVFIEENKDIIHEIYVIQGLGLQDTANKLNFPGGFQALWKYLRKMGWNRSVKQAKHTDSTKEKYKTTNIERYGVPHNFCRSHPSRVAWQKTMQQEEGLINVFQREEVKKQIRKTLMEKYGVSGASALPRKGRSNYSRMHQFMHSMLEWFLDEKIVLEKELIISDEHSYYYDLHIQGTNILIETNGDYWHGNPLIYKATDIVLYGTSNPILVSEMWEKDQKKLDFAKSLGYNVYVVWEHDLETTCFETCSKLLTWIGTQHEGCKNQIDQKDWPKQEVRFNRRKKSQLFCK